MTISGDIIIKEPIDEQGCELAKREKNWYQFAVNNGVTAIPRIDRYEPLTMERINGKNIYEIEASKETLGKIVNALKNYTRLKQYKLILSALKKLIILKQWNALTKSVSLFPLRTDRQ